ncbi:hypothetical protein L7F22_046700 [Adiantum nelumboides]|nr:hypothetical protein [Adiantum nelumboides]
MAPAALTCTSQLAQHGAHSSSFESTRRASTISSKHLGKDVHAIARVRIFESSPWPNLKSLHRHASSCLPVVAAAETTTAKAAVTPAVVKQLREETGAGMMDCKRALETNDGDFDKAREFLRKKGLASAEKKATRITAEGRIGSYIHDNRIGVLIEVNCETDFVARGEIFQQLVDDLAMQLVACQQVKFVSVEDIPQEFINKEKEIEMQKEDLLKKPEAIRSKIVDGRIAKMLNELALLEQAYIKDDSLLIKDLLKQTVATIGENIKVRRFERFVLGEGLQKRSQDFAAEVAAQTKSS